MPKMIKCIKACKRNEYKDIKTKRCKKLPENLKNWELERHVVLQPGEVDFWRNQKDKGFLSINKVESGAPAFDMGNFQIHINTPKTIDTKYRSN